MAPVIVPLRRITDLNLCEAQLDLALQQLRDPAIRGNLVARASIEFRIGALRQKREALR